MARERWEVPGVTNLVFWLTVDPSVVSLVLGAQPGKVYNNLRIISSRLKERF